MADKEKSIIERALMDAKRIQETLNANTKEILRSVAKEEIDGLVKESLTEESYVEEEINPNLNEEEKDEEIEDVELEDEESENVLSVVVILDAKD
jgi:predicted RND superfamily exporter protein